MYHSFVIEHNQPSLEAISQEALQNPFGNVTDTLKSAFDKVVNYSTGLIGKQKDEIPEINTPKGFTKELTEKQFLAIPFADVRKINVMVPTGFNGNLMEYAQLLEKQIHIVESLDKSILKPTHELILKLIGRPQLLSTISNSDFKAIKFHDDEIEKFKASMKSYFDFKHNYQSQPYSKVVNNQKEYVALIKQVLNVNFPLMLKLMNNRKTITKFNQDLCKSIDLLMIRIEQKPDQYSMNRVNAEKIANLINDVAKEVEFLAAVQVYNEQMITASCAIEQTVTNFITH